MKADDPWLIAAERFDSFRVVPRALIFGYCGFASYLIEQIVSWYTHIPLAEQSIQNAGMVTGIITAITGFGIPIFRIYSENGRDWNGAQIATTETVVSSKTSTP